MLTELAMSFESGDKLGIQDGENKFKSFGSKKLNEHLQPPVAEQKLHLEIEIN